MMRQAAIHVLQNGVGYQPVHRPGTQLAACQDRRGSEGIVKGLHSMVCSHVHMQVYQGCSMTRHHSAAVASAIAATTAALRLSSQSVMQPTPRCRLSVAAYRHDSSDLLWWTEEFRRPALPQRRLHCYLAEMLMVPLMKVPT